MCSVLHFSTWVWRLLCHHGSEIKAFDLEHKNVWQMQYMLTTSFYMRCFLSFSHGWNFVWRTRQRGMIADDNSIQLECQKNGQIECHVECQIERYKMSQYILRSISYIYIYIYHRSHRIWDKMLNGMSDGMLNGMLNIYIYVKKNAK